MKKINNHKLVGSAAIGQLIANEYVNNAINNIKPAVILFRGPSGVGKSDICQRLALGFAGDPININRVSGTAVDVATVNQWNNNRHDLSMYGTGRRVIIIEELDQLTQKAQAAMLNFMEPENLPCSLMILCTTNEGIFKEDRFESRFDLINVDQPEQVEIQELLINSFDIPAEIAGQISVSCAGNVRLAIKDAERYHIIQKLNAA